MSAAALVMLSRESERSSNKTSKSLRVNQPGDAFEQEADRVANTVSSGGHIRGWSLASTGADQIQRDSNTASALPAAQSICMIGDPQDTPAPNNYGDMLGKLAEAKAQVAAARLDEARLWNSIRITARHFHNQAQLEAGFRLRQLESALESEGKAAHEV